MDLAGAGGKWKTINERKDPTVIQQENDVSCGAACGQMLFKNKGINIEQEQINALAGCPTWSEQLASNTGLNKAYFEKENEFTGLKNFTHKTFRYLSSFNYRANTPEIYNDSRN